jgi:hypothetical protein
VVNSEDILLGTADILLVIDDILLLVTGDSLQLG